jgi:hypothetical protein
VIPLLAIPLAAKFAIATTLAAALFCSGLYMGHKWGVSSCYEATIEAQRHTVETGIQQAVVSDKTITKYVDRVQIVQGKSRTIIKEIKVYVKDSCDLSGGFRLWHDSAVNNELPAAGIIDAETVSLETVAETIAGNYGICHENSTTLSALQEWVKEQSLIR